MSRLKMYSTLALALTVLGGTSIASAVVLQLDFGPTTPTGSNLTNSPLHSIKPVTGNTWNKVETADVSSGLLFANGSSASGISLDLGASSNSNIVDFATQPTTSSALGTQVNTGIFSGNSVGKDAIFSGSAGQNNRLGIKIGGLPLGIYDVYVVGVNTNSAFATSQRSMNIGALATGNITTLDTGPLAFSLTTNFGPTFTSEWTAGVNYVKLVVEITASNPYLTIFTYNPDNLQRRGFLNAVQVELIPEPASLTLLGTSILLLFHRGRRA